MRNLYLSLVAVPLLLLSTSTTSLPPLSHPSRPATQVEVGADRLFIEFPGLVRGKRLALVTNHSGRLALRMSNASIQRVTP